MLDTIEPCDYCGKLPNYGTSFEGEKWFHLEEWYKNNCYDSLYFCTQSCLVDFIISYKVADCLVQPSNFLEVAEADCS